MADRPQRRRRPRPAGDGDEDGAIPTPPRQQNVCTPHDYSELRRAYRFVPEEPSSSAAATTTWQERMAQRYQSHLYREFVLADLTRYRSGQVGMRWRTKSEVLAGRGFDSCGNKHCPSYRGRADVDAARLASRGREAVEAVRLYERSRRDGLGVDDDRGGDGEAAERQENERLGAVPFGAGLADFEVNFSYVEGGEAKSELVKLRLCMRCAPMLFYGRGGAVGARRARDGAPSLGVDTGKAAGDSGCDLKKDSANEEDEGQNSDGEGAVGSSSSVSSRRSRRKKHKKRRSRKKKKRRKKKDDEHDDDRRQRRHRLSRHRRRRSCSSSSSHSGSTTSDDQMGSKRSKDIRDERRQKISSNDLDDRSRRKTQNEAASTGRNASGAVPGEVAASSSNCGNGLHADVESDDADAIEAERLLLSSIVSDIVP